MTVEKLDASNVALVRGRLSSAPRRRELPSGVVLVELDITTRGAAGSNSVPVVWFEPGELAGRLAKDDEVVVVGHVHRRFFRSGAVTQSRTEVVARRVLPAARRAPVSRLLGELAAVIAAV